ncbi:amino acid adenylation domain-containing protein [Pseudoroseomonas globiformis]|uniref:Amino acid adenylation domain-containing protein n=1 Tax=Teichococcus globiformis TaxID=2307229 RepID=A0ABV7FZP3_9PROT
MTPLTEAQSGLWYAQALDPANPIFNTGQYHDLRGPLDRAAFRTAVETMLTEADILSLRIVEGQGGPQQSTDPARRPVLDIVDLSATSDAEATARAGMARDMARATDPARDPMAVQRLYILAPERHLWYQRAHHLLLDAYGMELITRRVAQLYAGVPGQPLAPFAAALAEDERYRADPRRSRDAAYWLERLRDLPEVEGLVPRDRMRAEPITGRHALRHDSTLEATLSAPLRHAAAAHGIPWPDILAALTAAYIRRHAGTDEVSAGIAFMGRMGHAAARVPCTWMNVLPLRLRPDESAPLADYLAEAAKALTRLRRHGRYRGEQLRRDLGRVGAGRRLYGPLVNLLPFDLSPVFKGLRADLHILGTGPVDDVTLTFRGDHDAAGLRLEIEANPAFHDEAGLAAHAARLPHFIAQALGAERLADVPLATPAEAEWLLHGLNNTAQPVPDTTLAALIATRMRATPEAPALEFNGAVLSYAELDARSAALAATLRERGAGPWRIVAVALERSVELVVALLAVVRAGAAWLPLDPSHPAPRLASMVERAAPLLVLARTPLPGRTPVLPPSAWPSKGAAPDDVTPADPAYVLYTSGSTGEPKGVVVSHRAIVNRLEWMRCHYGFTASDRILQKTPATFDVSVWEFFLPFITGATLVVAPPGLHRDPAALAALMRETRITTAHFVPSMLAAFLREPASHGLAPARIFCSGEELTADLRDRFHHRIAAELHNLYGPTEAAVDVSFWPATPQDRSRPVPIGHPVWNTQLHVLDEALRPVPPGVAGHLHLGGVQLAEGYLGRPDLTEQAFIPDPFHPGRRLYRTGDVARRRQDGAVEFLGRADHQVKIRGQRIEPGEVEAALGAAPGIAQLRVIAREDRPGDKRLVAYLVPSAGYDEAALRGLAATGLPEAMRPSAYVALEALPVNGSGKLDRAALPMPASAVTQGRAPAPGTEATLARLFATVLARDAVGAEDDFFAAGGHSLLAVELMRRIRDRFGQDLGLGALFAHPSVAALATLLDGGGEGDHGLAPLIRLQAGDASLPPLFVVHPAGGLSWCYAGLARALAPRRSVWALQAPALTECDVAPDSLAALAGDYARRIAAVQPDGPLHLLGWSVGGIIAQAVAVELRATGRAPGVVAMLDSYPTDVWRAAPEPGENAPLRALLAIAGEDPDAIPDAELTRKGVVAHLQRGGSPLGQLPELVLDGVMRVVRGNNRLVRAHHHTRYEGRILHFRAALDHRESGLQPALWLPYVGGLDIENIPALHSELTGPAATARIAPLLARRLALTEEDHA